MNKYISKLDGMTITNQALAVSGYNYYGYQRWGTEAWMIMKEDVNSTTYTYRTGVGDYTNEWTNKATKKFSEARYLPKT